MVARNFLLSAWGMEILAVEKGFRTDLSQLLVKYQNERVIPR